MINEDKLWTKDELNEMGNPFPQYNKYSSYSITPKSQSQYFKILDTTIQLDHNLLKEQDRVMNYLSFTLLVDTLVGSAYRERALIDCSCAIKSDGAFTYAINLRPLSFINGQRLKAVLAYKQIATSPTYSYQVQVYIYSTVASNMRLHFIDFYTNGYSNRYAISGNAGNSRYNTKHRIDNFVGNVIAQNILVQNIDASFTTVYTNNIPLTNINYSSGSSITIYTETKFINISASTTQSLDTIVPTGNVTGQTINLIFYNGNTTIVNTGNVDTSDTNANGIVLKGLVNVTPTTKGNTITLVYNGTKWIEICRNF